MARGEKKGLFGRLFGRKDKSEGSEPDERQEKARLAKPVKATKGAADRGLPETVEKIVPDDAGKSDAVELELDIPENEISTVALSVEDLDVSLLSGEESGAPLLGTEKQAASGEASLGGTGSETTVGALESKLEASEVREADIAHSSEIAAEEVTEEEGRPILDEREAALKEVQADLTCRAHDELDIELDMEEDEVDLDAEAPEVSRPSPISVTDGQAAPATLDDVAAQHELTEDVANDETEAERDAALALYDTVEAEPSRPSGVSDVPLAGDLLCKLTPQMSAHAAALAQFVEDCQSPMRIAIRGEAGSGKTSLINAIESHLEDSILSLTLSARDYVGLGSFGPPGWQFLQGFIAVLEKSVSSVKCESFTQLAQELKCHLDQAAQVGLRSAKVESHALALEHPSVRSASTAVSELRSGLGSLVSQALDLVAARRLCVFLDDLDRLDAVSAVELIEAVRRFLVFDNSVFVAVCDPDTIVREAELAHPEAAGAGKGSPHLERTFQLSVNVPVSFATEDRLKDLLEMVGWQCSEEDLPDYVRLQRSSIGPSPRREKLVINKLMLMSKLRPDVCFGSQEDWGEAVSRQKLLFGLMCLQCAFPSVFDLLLSVTDDQKELSLVLAERLRTQDDVLALDRASGLFQEGSDRDDLSKRLVSFVDAFAGLLFGDDQSMKLDPESARFLRELLRLAATTGPSPVPEPTGDDAKSSALTQFCHRVTGRVREMLGDRAPDRSDKGIRGQLSKSAWFSLWYAPRGAKDAWGFGRVFYELGFDADRVVSVSLKCDTARVVELGVPRESINDLRSMALLQEPQFRFKDDGTGLVEIVTVLRQCSFDSTSPSSEDEVESVAEVLKDLILATHELFDVRYATAVPPGQHYPEQTEVPCKFCKVPLEQAFLKDGSIGYRCPTCHRVYRPKAAAKPM
jgi:hypothetical protein